MPSSTRERSEVHSAHIAILTLRRVRQPRDQARLQRARELGPQVRRQPHQLDRHRRHQVGILARELARDLVHDVVDQLEEVDAGLRALHQLLDLAGRAGALRAAPTVLDLHARRTRRSGWTPLPPSSVGCGAWDRRRPPVGGRKCRRGASRVVALRDRWRRGRRARALGAYRGSTGTPRRGAGVVGAAAVAAPAAATRRLLRARDAGRRAPPRSAGRCARLKRKAHLETDAVCGPGLRLSSQMSRRSSLGVCCGSFKFAPV